MSVRASSRLLRQSGRLGGGGGVVGLPSVGIRAASTAPSPAEDIAESPAGTSSAVKKNVYEPRPLPVSPLMDENENKYMPMSRRLPPKPQRPRGTEILSPMEEALKVNPYAKILATEVRNEIDFHRRLPSWFLIRFTILKHPETDEMYLVPDRIKEESQRQTFTAGRWAINNMQLFRLLEERKNWRKLVGHDIDGRKMVWKKNMAEHVLKITRERVRLETNKLQRREIVEIPWDCEGEGEVGCVLDWSKEEAYQSKECLTMVRGKSVPLHHMRILLGDEIATEIQVKLRIPDGVTRSGILLHERSLKAQMWLMRIRAYLGIY
ncbi:hypothetical protein DFP73DRAFT_49109 [Morchella snyderi]|nr:hypothetical protein DFP73DRAFT_49109 [Morchella snyderi]